MLTKILFCSGELLSHVLLLLEGVVTCGATAAGLTAAGAGPGRGPGAARSLQRGSALWSCACVGPLPRAGAKLTVLLLGGVAVAGAGRRCMPRDDFYNQNTYQFGSLAGQSLLTVYVGVVSCVSASLPRVLLPHTCTQDGWFLQPKHQPARLPRRTGCHTFYYTYIYSPF
jgi:hypothetical protein